MPKNGLGFHSRLKSVTISKLIVLKFAILIFANLVSVLTIGFLARISISPQHIHLWMLAYNSKKIHLVSNYAPFPITLIIVIFIYLPLFKELKRGVTPKDLPIKLKHFLIRSPMTLSLLAVWGWFLGFTLLQVLSYYAGIIFPTKLIIENLNFIVVLSGITFVVSYYGVEYLVLQFVMPQLFPDGRIDISDNTFKFSIKKRLLLFYFSSVILPMLIFYRIMISLNNHGKNIFNTDLYIEISIFCIAILTITLLITILKSISIQNPILKMAFKSKEIQKGNFDDIIPITSADEIGELAQSLNKMADGLKDRAQLSELISKMIDPKVRDYLMHDKMQLGGELKNVTILFSDLKDFTTLSEKMKPGEVVALLNSYFEGMSNCINKNGGVVNKYMGDAILAVFGAPQELTNHAEAAVLAAIEMQKFQAELNNKNMKYCLPLVQTRIGIHTGEAFVGNIGSNNRMEYTVIGDTVNTAARLEQLGKSMNKSIIISSNTINLVPQYPVNIEKTINVKIPGKTKPIDIFTYE